MSVQPNRSRKKQQKIAYELAVALEEAKEAGIPVILSDRRAEMEDDSLYTCWVGSDFAEEGRNAGHWLENYLEKQGRSGETVHIVSLQGTLGSSAQIGRTD